MKKEEGFSSIFGRKRGAAPGISNRQNYPNFVPPLTDQQEFFQNDPGELTADEISELKTVLARAGDILNRKDGHLTEPGKRGKRS